MRSTEGSGGKQKAVSSRKQDEAERSYAGIRIEEGGRECEARRAPGESFLT